MWTVGEGSKGLTEDSQVSTRERDCSREKRMLPVRLGGCAGGWESIRRISVRKRLALLLCLSRHLYVR